MKKILMALMLVCTLIIMPKSVYAKDNVTIYIFRGSTCSHCEEALEYLNKHKDEINENVEVVTYEVFDNANNSKLQDKVAEELGVDTEADNYGVPFIVIGEEYIKGYGGVSTFNQMMSISEDYLQSDDYKDVVKDVIKTNNMQVKAMTLDDLFSEPSKTVTIVVYSIFGLIVAGIGAMIVFSRK